MKSKAENLLNKILKIIIPIVEPVAREMGRQKIVITINKKGINSNITTIITKKKNVPLITKEEARKLKETKKALKNNLDAIMLLTLLIKTKQRLEKIDKIKITGKGKQVILETIKVIGSILPNKIKMLEVKNESIVGKTI